MWKRTWLFLENCFFKHFWWVWRIFLFSPSKIYKVYRYLFSFLSVIYSKTMKVLWISRNTSEEKITNSEDDEKSSTTGIASKFKLKKKTTEMRFFKTEKPAYKKLLWTFSSLSDSTFNSKSIHLMISCLQDLWCWILLNFLILF